VKPIEPSNANLLEEAQNKWMNEVQTVVSQRLGELLKYVNSVHEIQSLREAAHAMLSETKRIPHGRVSVWELAYRPLLTQRVRQIIQHQMDQILIELKTKLEQSINNLQIQDK